MVVAMTVATSEGAMVVVALPAALVVPEAEQEQVADGQETRGAH